MRFIFIFLSFIFLGTSSAVYSEQLETVVVSASPIASGKEVSPIAITRLSKKQLDIIQATHPSEISASVPGAWVSRGDGQEHLTAIRSPVFTGAGACGAFVIAEDSIPVRAPGFCNVNQLFDTQFELADSIEVFRGPSSTVFGSNGLFGGVNVLSPAPSSSNTLGLEFGSNDYKRVKYNLVGKQKKHQAYGVITDAGSFRKDSAYKQQKIGFKLNTSLRDWRSESALHLNNIEQETAGYIQGFEAYLDDEARTENAYPEAYRNAYSVRANSKWVKQGANAKTVVQPYLRMHRMQFLMHFVPWQPTEKNQHNSLGLRVFKRVDVSDVSTVTLGVESDFSEGELEEYQANPAPFAQLNFPQGMHYNYQVKSSNVSPYLEYQYLTPTQWQLNTQLRWESVKYDYNNRIDAGYACEQSATACRFYRPESREDQFNSPSWRLGFVRPLINNVKVFGNIASAYRAPQTTELYRAQSATVNDLEPVKVDGIEMGFRYNTTQIQSELNLYSMQQKNAIYQNSDRQYLVGAESSHRGLEYSVKANLTSALSVRGVGSYAVHRYENSPDLLGVSESIDGNEMDTAPKVSYQAQLSWQYAQGSVTAAWNTMGKYYLDAENKHQYDGHRLLDVTWAHKLNTATALQVRIRNILDKQYAERADYAFGDYRYFPGSGRTVHLVIRQSL